MDEDEGLFATCDLPLCDSLFLGAIRQEKAPMVQWLCREVTITAGAWHVALFLCARGGFLDTMKLLLAASAPVEVHACDDVALRASAYYGRRSVVAWLLSDDSRVAWTQDGLAKATQWLNGVWSDSPVRARASYAERIGDFRWVFVRGTGADGASDVLRMIRAADAVAARRAQIIQVGFAFLVKQVVLDAGAPLARELTRAENNASQ